MNILLIGSGGREHALARALSASPSRDRLFIAPGNPGTARCGVNVRLKQDDIEAIVAFCREESIGLVVIGPEAPLVAGIVDDLEAAGIVAFGPSKSAARLEGSKAFMREFCAEFNIPGAAFAAFNDPEAARAHIRHIGAPVVVKADGLAAGKGVVVAETMQEAIAAVDLMASGGFGAAGATILVEEKLKGEEASFFALCDGETALPFGSAQDHKRALDGDEGPNTGGMGAYSPTPAITPELERRIMAEIVHPTLAGMRARGTPFRGILFAGLMLTERGPRLIEFNVRFGDPECQVLLPRLKSDLLSLLLAAREGRLADLEPRFDARAALSVVMAAPGYPQNPRSGTVIKGIEKAEAMPDVLVFHAGTALVGKTLTAQGGRVLAVTGLGATIAEARARAYAAVAAIDWPQGQFRRDIGWRALAPR